MPDRSQTGRSPLLEVKSVSKRFAGLLALDAVSLSVFPGEVLALAGDNGAGKSTLIKIISGAYRPDSGEIWYEGEQRRFESPGEARAAGIETIYQDLALADNLDIGANIFLGREPTHRRFGIKVLDRRKMRAAAESAAKALDMDIENFDAPVGQLSGGQRQAVAIGRAIYGEARLVIMDEPMAALNATKHPNVLALIQTFRDRGCGVIFVAHDLDSVFATADRIVVLRGGVMAGEHAKAATNPDEIVRLMSGG